MDQQEESVWRRRLWRPLENRWILAGTFLIILFGMPFLLRRFGGGDPDYLWLYGLTGLLGVLLFATGVVRYRKDQRPR